MVADTVYTNGRIYTVNEAQPWVEAVTITGGKFTAVGSAANIDALIGDGTEVMPIKEFVDAGATVTFGSDWPAAPLTLTPISDVDWKR